MLFTVVDLKRFLVLILLMAVIGVSASAVPPRQPNVQLEPTPLYDDNDAYCLATFTDPDSNSGELVFNY